MRKTVAILATGLALTGCGSADPPWTREYAETVTRRVYPGTSPAAALRAAEDVLRLADSDTTFAYRRGGLTAQRPYLLYLVLAASSGTYFYEIAAEPVTGGTALRMNLAISSSAVVANAFTGAQVTPANASAINYREPYDLFFARTDHLLGRRPDWVSCSEAQAKLGIRHGTEAFCASADDRAPAS